MVTCLFQLAISLIPYFDDTIGIFQICLTSRLILKLESIVTF